MNRAWVLVLWATLLALPFALLAAVDAAHGPSTHAPAEHCTRACHDRGCVHLLEVVDPENPVVQAARGLYVANLEALRAPSIGYRDTNLLVYVVGFPLLYASLLLVVLWRAPPRVVRPATVGAGLGLVALLGSVALRPSALLAWGRGADALYWACTDFCVHMGNLTGLTYEGFNFLLFVVGFPFTLIALIFAAGWSLRRTR